MKIRTTNKKLVIGVFAVLIAFSMIATAGLLLSYGEIKQPQMYNNQSSSGMAQNGKKIIQQYLKILM